METPSEVYQQMWKIYADIIDEQLKDHPNLLKIARMNREKTRLIEKLKTLTGEEYPEFDELAMIQ